MFTSPLHRNDRCLRIHCRGHIFAEPLPSNERLLWLNYSGFQASCHMNRNCYLDGYVIPEPIFVLFSLSSCPDPNCVRISRLTISATHVTYRSTTYIDTQPYYGPHNFFPTGIIINIPPFKKNTLQIRLQYSVCVCVCVYPM
jgi:hypothetical protein